MDGIRATFTQKFGPLPVWGWAAIALAALGAYLYLTHKGPFSGATSGNPASSAGPGSGSPGSDLSSLLGSYGQWQPNLTTPYSGGFAGGGGGIMPPVSGAATSAPDSAARGSSTATVADPPPIFATTAPVTQAASFTPSPGVPTARIAAKYPVYSPPASTGKYSPTIFTARGPISTEALASLIGSPRTFNPIAGRSSGTKAFA